MSIQEKQGEAHVKFEMRFGRLIRMYYSRIQSQLAEVGLYRGQPPILMLLYKNDGMSQKEMARALNLSPATMTVTLKRMEKAGLVLREMDEHDQRILQKGREMCETGESSIGVVTAELLEGFTLEEQQQLNEYLGRIARNMERVVEKEPEQDKTGVKNF